MRKGIRLAVVAAAVCGATGAARADTLKAPTDSYESIQAAINAAAPGDTVLVLAGEHDEAPVLTGRSGITLRGSRQGTIRGLTIVEGCSDITVKGLTIDNAEDGVFVSDSEDITITGVQITDFSDDGIQVDNSSGVKIEKCHIHGGGGDGIESNNVSGVTIQKNRFEDIEGDAIDVGLMIGAWDEGEGALIQKNRIDRAGNGIVTEGDGVGIFANTTGVIQDIAVSHFSSSGDSHSRISRNRIGVLVDDDFYTPGDSGSVGIQFQGSNCLIDGNTVDGCGIVENGQGNRIEKNKIIDADTGIDCSGNFSTLYRNTCRGGDTGIVSRGNFAIIDMNKVLSPEGTGIVVATGNVITFRNRVSNAGTFGFHVLTSGNDFEGDRAAGSEFFDLRDEAGLDANDYTDCRFPNQLID